jgi:hypothetical protein
LASRSTSSINPISEVRVGGFKSLRSERAIDIRPLTVLAGANSSGKSSILQPLLLLKQTLEVPYDPGPLLLSGPNVAFTSMEQLLWHGKRREDRADEFSIGLAGNGKPIALNFGSSPRGVTLNSLVVREKGGAVLREGMSEAEIHRLLPMTLPQELSKRFDVRSRVQRVRCSLAITADLVSRTRDDLVSQGPRFSPFDSYERSIRALIHLPGLRGNPARSYPVTEVGDHFPGLFQHYVASVISAWKANSDPLLVELGDALRRLGLTWKVDARPLEETSVELRVGRLIDSQQGGASDLVNVADVGFGVTQVLPVLVALLVAKPGQLVYLEQPEIHLHPKAQVALAQLLFDAAKRGALVVVETHSYLLLRAIQTNIAQRTWKADQVVLHWFQRDANGETSVVSGNLDQSGAFGAWPEDFSDVQLSLDDAFLTASMRAREA